METAILVKGGHPRPFEHSGRLDSLIAQAQALLSQPKYRADGANRQNAMGFHRREENVRRIDAKQRELRSDSFNPQLGFHQARELEQTYSDVLREEYPQKTAMTLFHQDNTLQPGARFHTVQRIYDLGEVGEYRAGQKVPTVSAAKLEERFPVKHYVTSIVYDLFESLSSGFANTSEIAEKMRVARDLMQEFANIRTWYGASGFYGVLNYPWLRKRVIAQAMNSTDVSSDSDKSAVVDAVLALWDAPADDSFSTFSPTDMATSGRLIRYWQRTYFTDGSGDSIWKRITETIPPASIHVAPELNGVGPAGSDGILCYRRDRLGIANCIAQPFTGLPLQSFGFDNLQYFYMTHGGVIMRNVANNILGWVDAG